MSYRSKRSRLAHASKVKDATTQSVEDKIAQVIQDVAPETLLSSSGNISSTTEQPAMNPPFQVQVTATESDDNLSNQRNATGRQRLTPPPTQPLSTGTPRPVRASKRLSAQVQDASNQPPASVNSGGFQTSETQINSCYNHWTDDPARIELSHATTTTINNAGNSRKHIGGRQPLTPPPNQPLPADSPCQFKDSQRERLWDQDDGEEPVQQEFSNAQPSRRPEWSDDIQFDEKEEVEMRDLEGRHGKKGGRILPRHVWSLQPGVRFVVPFNSLDQPLGKGGYVLVRFLGDVAKKGELCPIGEVNWHKVDKSYKADIVVLVGEKFVLPNREDINKAILKHVGKKWRGYRHELKVQYKKPGQTEEQVSSVVPEGVVPSQWIKLVQYWFSDKHELLSTKGREARAAVSHLHTTGSKSFAQKRDEFQKANGREPGPLEWFIQTHQRKDGTYVEKSSKEFLDAAAAMIAQRASTSSTAHPVAIENQVFNELMYSDDERYHRPIGYGFGVNRNKIFGVEGELRKKGYLASGFSADTITVPRNKLLGVGGERKRSSYMALDTSAEVERLKFAVAAMSETNELMQSQLQTHSQQLQMQSQQLQMQSQQMEGLRFQLQQVTSSLTKFGAMLNKPPLNTTPKGTPCQGVKFTNAQVLEASCESSDGGSESSEWESD